jgi:NHLM bacteriocin system ABC transporter ATP-binding protein
MSDAVDSLASQASLEKSFDNPRQCWRVSGASLDVFAVPVNAAGEQVGTGHHLFTIEPDQVGFGVTPCPLTGDTWLAIRTRRRSSEGLSALSWTAFAAAGAVAADLANAIDQWLTRFAACRQVGDPPNMFAEPNREGQQAAEGIRIGSLHNSVLWLTPENGALRFWTADGAITRAGEPPIPVVDGHWALASEPTFFSASTTNALIDTRAGQERLWQAFERVNALLLSLAAQNLISERARETARIAGRLRQSSAAFSEGLKRAGAVLRKDVFSAQFGIVDDPLFAAASIVAARQKITLKRIPRAGFTDPGEYLDALTRASQTNLRQVTLERDWFRRDNGPLMGFVSRVDGTTGPVALLPLKRSGYESLDPEQGKRLRIDPRQALMIAPTAFMFYRGLDNAPVTVGTLIRFGLTGMSRDLVRVLVMGLLGGLLSLALPLISEPLFNDILPQGELNTLSTVVLALATAALGASAFEVVRNFSLLRVEGRLEARVQAAVWDRLLRLPPGFFHRYTTGDLADRVLNLSTIRSVLTLAISGSILDAIFSVLSFVLMFWYSWRLALVAVGLAVVAVLLTVALTWLQIPQQRALMSEMGRVGGLTYQLLTAIGKLRIAGAEARAFGRWTGVLAQQKEYAYRARRIAAAQHTLTQAFPPLTSVALYFAMVKLGEPIAGSEKNLPLLTLGEYLAFSTAFGQFVSALMSVVRNLTSLVMIVPVYERVQPVLSNSPETRDVAQSPGVLAGDIEFRHLIFRYRDDMPPVLNDVSFHVRPGEYIALVGPSGSGKSTIVRLALGFETAQSGSVFFDEQDIATLDLGELRRQIGVVLQSARLLAGSLYENIAGSQPISMEEAWEAARLAGLDSDIRAMPMGMHTYLSDSASMLSGGQRQRVVIARALVGKPRILIFDEATSALDNHTQAIVNATLTNLNLTRIVIAHRLSTVREVDRILVLKQGRIVETGSYDELLARGGTFSELAKQQLV